MNVKRRCGARAAGWIGVAVMALVAPLAAAGEEAGAGSWPGSNGKIAFKSGNDQIWVMDPDGANKVQLTTGTVSGCFAGDEEPQWSPDGTRLVFTRTALDGQEVWSMNADGSSQTRLTTSATGPCEQVTAPGMFSENPSWSPDGSRIIFTSDRSSTADDEDLWIMNADGSGQTQFFGDTTHHESEAFFSPNGTKIVFQVEPTPPRIAGISGS